MAKNILLWSFVASFLLCILSSTAAPQAMDTNALQQMGSILGLPMGREDASTEHEDVPEFVKDIHDCWNSNQSDDCLPGYHGTDVNQLRASLGISEFENQSALPALHSFNKKRKLKNSLAISFNVSLTGGQRDVIRYAMLRVYRKPVDNLALLQENCSNLSNLSLQLYTQTSTEGGNPVFSLRGVQSLSQANFTQGAWVEFLNLTTMYKSLIATIEEELEDGALATAVLNTRLTVNSPSCSSLSPSGLGFVSVAEHRAQLVVFEENLIENEVRFSDVMSIIARSRRNSETVELSIEAPSNQTRNPEPTQPTNEPLNNPGDYRYPRCQLYRHYISFASLGEGWEQIISPSGFTANFCAGHCEWPLPSHNRHAYIQSFANFQNSELFPPPCCAPVPGSFYPLSVLTRGENEEYISRTYSNMVATKCNCA